MFLGFIDGVVVLLLLVGALMDWRTRRRGSQTLYSGDIAAAVRNARRDAQIIDSAGPLLPRDTSWTSWSRRNIPDGEDAAALVQGLPDCGSAGRTRQPRSTCSSCW
jgi:hypothetical protein